jgi:uncharacterized membrane protein
MKPMGSRTESATHFTPAGLHLAVHSVHFVASPWPPYGAFATVRSEQSSFARNAMTLTPTIAIHMTAAIAAVVTGPVALWARKGRQQRPRLHRAFGYAWVTLMIIAATSALFIHDPLSPGIGPFGPIHLLIPATFVSLYAAFRALAAGNIARHRRVMQSLYIAACIVAGAFTLLPDRLIGKFVWGHLPPVGMVGHIFTATPAWVWGLLAALLVMGYLQMRDRTVGLARVMVLPVVMGSFAVLGMVSAFGTAPRVVVAWLMSATLLVYALLRTGPAAGVRYDAAKREFFVPGSWVPMVLILAVFLTRYVVNVSLTMHPELKSEADVAIAISALYGVISGLFAGRALGLVRLALRPAAAPLPALAA